MANTPVVEKYAAEKKESNVCDTSCGENMIQESESRECFKVKVQLPKTSCKGFPSEGVEETKLRDIQKCTKEEELQNNNITEEKEGKNNIKIKLSDQSTEKTGENKTECQDCSTAKNNNSEEQDMATAARLRAQRRWRMGLLKRSKLGGIGQEVTGLFPDYFPSSIATEKSNEEDDILTSLKESKQRHRAKLLKQNSIDKIDRELGDRETKLIAGSWLEIYS